MKKKLKPVVFVQGERKFYRENIYGQNLLIKAMSEGVTSPVELKKIAGLSSVAEVYRTLDKLSLRKEYHEALSRSGITLDLITDKIKEIMMEGSTDAIRLRGCEVLLKSLGLDRYERNEESGKGWEELINEASEKKSKKKEVKEIEGEIIEGGNENSFIKYEVKVPKTPESEKKIEKEEREVAKHLYE